MVRFNSGSKNFTSSWRFNTSLIHDDEKSSNFIKKNFLEYWEFNEGSITNHGLEWDAFKACLRGRLIQHTSYFKKQSTIRLLNLEKVIKELEKSHAFQLNLGVLSHLNKLKYELNSILQKKAEYALFRCRLGYYEQRETAGRFLAQRAKQQYNQTLITSVLKDDRVLTTDNREINETFRTFYHCIYRSSPNQRRI